VVDLHRRARGQRRRACRVVDNLGELGEIHLVGVANVEVGDGVIGHYVRRGATFVITP
jgi:hypothetical protein